MNAGSNEHLQPRRIGRSNTRLRIVGPSTARGRFRVILPMLHFKAREATGQGSWLLLPQGVEVLTLTALVMHLSRQFRVSPGTIWKWYARFLESGFHGLADRPRRDRFILKAFRDCPGAAALVASKHSLAWSPARIHRELCRIWPALRTKARCPSYGTVVNSIASMAPASPRKKTNKRPRPQLAVVAGRHGNA